MFTRVILIAPAINEIDGIRAVFPKLDRKLLSEIIVVDLNSTDGTAEYCHRNGYVHHQQRSKGYGAGYMEVLADNNADVIIEFPPDGSSPPEKISDLLTKLDEGYDMVVASRYKDGAKSYDDSILTRFGNWLFTTLINVLFHTKYTDTLVGFRAYRRSAYDKANLTTKGLSWTAQQAIRFKKAGLKVAEIGADEPARIGGIQKMQPLKTGLEILRVIVKEFFISEKVFSKHSKLTSETHFDKIANDYDYWKKKNWYYHKNLKDTFRLLIPPGSRVMEIGCGTGHVLASLEPSYGYGVDISEEIARLASDNYSDHTNLKFEAMNILDHNDLLDYDYVIMADAIDHIENLQKFISHVASRLKHGAPLIISTVNPIWEPILNLAEKLKMKMPEGPHSWLSIEENEAIFIKSGLKITNKGYRLLIPKNVPGATWINKRFHKYPLLARFGFGAWWVLKRI